MTVHVKSREKVTVPGIVLYLLHRERIIICEKADTRVPEFMEPDMRELIFIKELSKLMRYTVRRY